MLVVVDARGVLLGVTGVPSLLGVPVVHRTCSIHRNSQIYKCLFNSAKQVPNSCSGFKIKLRSVLALALFYGRYYLHGHIFTNFSTCAFKAHQSGTC